MIYMEPHMLGWRPLLLSWLNTLPTTINDDMKDLITENFDRLVPPMLNFIRKGGVKVRMSIAFCNWYMREVLVTVCYASPGASQILKSVYNISLFPTSVTLLQLLIFFICCLTLQELSPTTNTNIVKSCMNLMDCMLDEFQDEESFKKLNEREVASWLEVCVIKICMLICNFKMD